MFDNEVQQKSYKFIRIIYNIICPPSNIIEALVLSLVGVDLGLITGLIIYTDWRHI